MRKLLIVSLMFLMIVSVANASITRRDSLGIADWMFEDDSNIWLSPAQINLYPKMIWGELGSAYPATAQAGGTGLNNQWGGVSFNVDLMVPWVWGIFVARPYAGQIANVGTDSGGSDLTTIAAVTGPYAPSITGAGPGGLDMSVLNPDGKVDILAGMDVSDNLKLGIGLGLSMDSASGSYAYKQLIDGAADGDGNAKNIQKSNEINVDVGAYLVDWGPFAKADVVIGYTLPKVENTYHEAWFNHDFDNLATVDMALKTDSAMGYQGIFRGISDVRDDVNLITNIGYGKVKVDSNFTDVRNLDGGDVMTDDGTYINTLQEREYNVTGTNLGMALNIDATARTLVIAGASLRVQDTVMNGTSINREPNPDRRTQQYNVRTTVITVPLNFAVEHQLARWLVSRAGVQKNVSESNITEVHDPNLTADDRIGNAIDNELINDPSTATVYTIGLGASVTDRLTLDFLLQQEVLFSGGFMQSGVPGQALSTAITALYRF